MVIMMMGCDLKGFMVVQKAGNGLLFKVGTILEKHRKVIKMEIKYIYERMQAAGCNKVLERKKDIPIKKKNR